MDVPEREGAEPFIRVPTQRVLQQYMYKTAAAALLSRYDGTHRKKEATAVPVILSLNMLIFYLSDNKCRAVARIN